MKKSIYSTLRPFGEVSHAFGAKRHNKYKEALSRNVKTLAEICSSNYANSK